MADKKISELDAITGAATAADDFFIVVDTSGSATKKISRAELNNAIEQDVLAQVDITSANIDGGTIDNTPIGATTPSTGDFTTVDTTGDVTVGGNLTVNGTTTTVNSTTLEVDDINITVASGAADAAAADGAGLTVDGASATFNYASSGDKWTMNKPLDVTGTVTADGADISGGADSVGELILSQGNGSAKVSKIVGTDTGGTNERGIDFNTFYYADYKRMRIAAEGNISFYDSTGVSQGLFWQASTQRLGIGDTTPDDTLTVYGGTAKLRIGSTDSNHIRIGRNTTSGNFEMSRTTTGATDQVFFKAIEANNGNIILQEGGGNVGIGVSPAFPLQVKTNTTTNVGFFDYVGAATVGGVTDVGASAELRLAGDVLSFTGAGGAGAEHMRLDASGNLLAGTTSNFATISTTASESGHVFIPSGGYAVARAGAPIYANRTGTDGDIAVFRYGGSTIGSIGNSGANLYIEGNTSGKSGLEFGGTAISPRDSGSLSDGVNDLGSSGNRFKDLYLSGGVYLGGTGSGNLLSDYEEGTWEPTLITGSGTPTFSYNDRGGNYTKIGNKVIAWFYADISVTVAGAGQSGVAVSSLPFSPASDSLTSSAYTRGGFVTAHPTGTNTSAMGFNNINPASATVAYFQGLARDGGDSTAGLQTGVYAGYLIYEAT